MRKIASKLGTLKRNAWRSFPVKHVISNVCLHVSILWLSGPYHNFIVEAICENLSAACYYRIELWIRFSTCYFAMFVEDQIYFLFLGVCIGRIMRARRIWVDCVFIYSIRNFPKKFEASKKNFYKWVVCLVQVYVTLMLPCQQN
jgi:hypothetical protein